MFDLVTGYMLLNCISVLILAHYKLGEVLGAGIYHIYLKPTV